MHCMKTKIAVMLIGIAFLAPVEIFAQPGPKSAPLAGQLPPAEKTHLQLYRLTNVRADEVSKAIERLGLINQNGLAIDVRTNALLVRTSKEKHDIVEAVLKWLDTNVDEPKTSSYLVHKDRLKLAEEVLRDSVDGNFRVDRDTGELFVTAAASDHEKIQDIIKKLTKPTTEQKPAKSVQVRVAWLVTKTQNSAPVPKDLGKVVAELERLGISNLSLAAQSIVRTMPQNEFQISAKVQLDSPCDLRIEGILDESNKMDIVLSAVSLQSKPSESLTEIKTTISAPEGHSVVLGVSPIGKQNSVFVVTVYGD